MKQKCVPYISQTGMVREMPAVWLTDIDDYYNGESGNDTIFSAGGNDYVFGGGGNDWIQGGDGNDSVFGQTGNDVLYGENGDDYLFTGAIGSTTTETNTAYGGFGNDVLLGEISKDTLNGADGNDTLDGAGGTDRLEGGNGDDTYVFSSTGNYTVREKSGSNDVFKFEMSMTSFVNSFHDYTEYVGSQQNTRLTNGSFNILIENTGDVNCRIEWMQFADTGWVSFDFVMGLIF